MHTDLTPNSPTTGLRVGLITTPDGDGRSREVDETGQAYDGACFLFRVNNAINSKWGRSDLLILKKWLNQSTVLFTDIVQHIYWLTQFVWDVQIEGATEALVNRRKADIRANPPSRGSVLLHNEKELWKAVTPDLRQEDISSASRTLIWWIAGIGSGIPEHWLGWGWETTRATAKEMQSPTLHMLEDRQDALRDMLTGMCLFQIDQAIRARVLPADVNKSFTLTLPNLLPPDTQAMASALNLASQALSTDAARAHVTPEITHQVLAALTTALVFAGPTYAS